MCSIHMFELTVVVQTEASCSSVPDGQELMMKVLEATQEGKSLARLSRVMQKLLTTLSGGMAFVRSSMRCSVLGSMLRGNI